MKVLLKFFHSMKVNDTIKYRFTENQSFKSDTSLTRTVCFASWEKSPYIFSKYGHPVNMDTFYGPLNIRIKGV